MPARGVDKSLDQGRPLPERPREASAAQIGTPRARRDISGTRS